MKVFETKDYKAFTMFKNVGLLLQRVRLMILIRVQLVGAVWVTCGACLAMIYLP